MLGAGAQPKEYPTMAPLTFSELELGATAARNNCQVSPLRPLQANSDSRSDDGSEELPLCTRDSLPAACRPKRKVQCGAVCLGCIRGDGT